MGSSSIPSRIRATIISKRKGGASCVDAPPFVCLFFIVGLLQKELVGPPVLVLLRWAKLIKGLKQRMETAMIIPCLSISPIVQIVEAAPADMLRSAERIFAVLDAAVLVSYF